MPRRMDSGSTIRLGRVVALAIVCVGLGHRAEAQCETKHLAPDGAAQDRFGNAVSIDGDVLVVGAYGDDDHGDWSGSVYVYRSDTMEAKLTASDGAASDSFGYSVTISGDVVVVGATGNDDNGDASGSAYVFRYDGSEWIEEVNLLASDGADGDVFGGSVSVDGDAIAVGASGDDSVYVFRYDGSTWIEEAKLQASDGYWADSFASAVAISGDAVVVGAPGDNSDTGSAYVYRYDGSGWVEEDKLTAIDGDSSDRFGKSVSIDGDAVVIGAHHDEANGYKAGSAYVFRYNGFGWTQEDKLIASDGLTYDTFGESVSVSGDLIVVGAVWVDDHGAAYLYRFNGSWWIEKKKLLASDREIWDWFGDVVSIDGDSVLVGAYGDGDNGDTSGSVYVYDLSCGENPTLTVSPDPLVAGQDGTFTGLSLNPNSQTYLAYSLVGLGSTYIAPLNVTLDLDQPAQAGGMMMSDGGGTAEWVLYVPMAGAGRNVWFQACQYELTTNVVETSVD